VSGRVDFSRAASTFDRRHGAVLSAPVLGRLVAAAGLVPGARILDVGAGTGRVSLALAGAGFDVVALDPAKPMLDSLRGKGADQKIGVVVGEGARLPFAAARFDAVVLARILYLMTDWRTVLTDVTRVLKPGGSLLHEWGNGSPDEEWVQIREHARRLFEQAGVANPFHPGVRSEVDVEAFLEQCGLKPVGEVRGESEQRLTLGDFLARIINGECSYTWNVPVEVQSPCLAELRAWVQEHYDLDRSFPFPREIVWKIYSRPASPS